MERWHAKLITGFLSFFIPLLCTLLPLKLNSYFEKKGEHGKRILSYLMCLGGGIFFATFMLHMAPEARDIVEYSLTGPRDISYPLADLFMAIGFFLVLVCEKLVMILNNKRKSTKKPKESNKCLSNGHHAKQQVNDKIIDDGVKAKYQTPITDIENLADPNCPLYGSGSCCKDPEEVTMQANANEETGFFGTSHVEFPHDHFHGHDVHLHEEAILVDSHSTRALILLVALSLHRIFEGMSIGLQHTTANVVNLFIAVMCHETVIGFSLGLQFVKHKWQVRRILIACVLCSLIMPIGVVIGTLMVELGNTSNTIDIVNGLLQSLATGTFIYVTFFEILQEELHDDDDLSLCKVFCVILGFGLMAALCAIPEEAETLTGHDVEMTTVSSLLNSTVLNLITTVAN